jgi:hypothetical protein
VLYTLAGADRYQIEVEVPAGQLSLLDSPQAEVRIRGSQWPAGQYRRGEFIRVIPVLEEQGRLARVLVELPDPLAQKNPAQPPLFLNDLARVEITGRTSLERVRIPLAALQDGDLVWVVDKDRIHIQAVRIAYLTGEYAVLESGLRGGETLVATRLTTVTEGLKVRVQRVEDRGRKTEKSDGEQRLRPKREIPEPEQGERG